jgi:hypothetical protein
MPKYHEVQEVKKERQPNPWLTHVAAYRTQHPDSSYKECLKEAAKSYTKKQTPSPPNPTTP